MMQITPEDVADRIYRRVRIWRGPDPSIEVTGEPGKFGKILLVFKMPGRNPGETVDFPVAWSIYVSKPEDLQHYQEVVEQAVRDYDLLVNRLV